MTAVYTTKASLATTYNNQLSLALVPVGKIHDVTMRTVVGDYYNTEVSIYRDMYYNKTVPPGLPDTLRYLPRIYRILRADLSTLTGYAPSSPDSTFGNVHAVDKPVGAAATVDLLPLVNTILGTSLTGSDIVVTALPTIPTGGVLVTIQMDPLSFKYTGSITLAVYPTGH